MENQASKRLAKGTIVYMVGNLSSKLLQMLILPVITASLVTSQYGYYDMVVTTISLVTPIITFQIIEGMFRFVFNSSDEDKKKTVSTATAFLICGVIILAGIISILYIATPIVQYPILIFFNYVSTILFNYTQKLARCLQKNKQFAISGVVNTFVMLGCQAVTLLVFKMGVDGMLIANALSYIVASLYLAFFLNIKKLLNRNSIDVGTLKKLLKYSAPLVPNSLAWWVVASSDRYVITGFLGSASNGVYSIAGKFSQLLTFITTVFQLAWQESAIMEAESENRNKFYSSTFNAYMKLLLGGYLVVLPFIKIIIPILLAPSYQIGWLYNPILLIGAVLAAFSQFYGSAYIVFKKTGGAFSTTVVAAVINLVIAVGFIKWIGLFAPALGTAVSFGIQWLLRAIQMRKYFKVTIDYQSLIFLLICGIIVTSVYYVGGIYLQLVSMIGGVIVFCIVNKDLLKFVLKKMKIMR